MPSCTHVFAVIFVLLTTVALIIAFFTPHWIDDRYRGSVGLWLECSSNDWSYCRWFFENDFALENQQPVWVKATQGLYSCAIATCLITLTIALCSICCSCYHCNEHHATAAFANITFFLMAVSMCVYGAKANLERNVGINPDGRFMFGWSFWLAVGGTGLSLITTILYFCVGRKDRYRI